MQTLPAILFCVSVLLTPVRSYAQQPPADTPQAPAPRPLDSRCASCHGSDATGGSAPSIVPFVRYHTDAEVTEVIAKGITVKGMPAFQLPADDLRDVLAELRSLTGTDPSMATGGFTGKREVRPVPLPSVLRGENQGTPASLPLTDGKMLQGSLMAQSDFDAQLLAPDGKFHLLAREGDKYRDKPIEPKSDWLTYHGTDAGNRYSPLKQINTSTVQKLAPVWMFSIPTSPRLETTPIVVDGIMYVTGWNEVYALDSTTGHVVWSYNEPRHEGILSEAGSGANRGVAVSGDRVFMITDHAHVVALNRKTGTKLWDVEMGSYKENYSASGAPMVVGDTVVVGVAGGEEGARGFVDAYKMDSGERAWRFYTVPKRGEKGSETWIGNAIEHGCGATWLTGSYDPALDLIYWGVGNPCPDMNGEERKGDNLYTASVVALSGKTGELKWYYQFTPHDTHDWDATEPMVLADEQFQGKPRKLLIHGDRNGYFFVLDRTTGELLSASPLSTKVTWTTGYGKDGRPILTSTFESTPDGVALCPAGGGGANWPDVSYNPGNKLFYVRVNDSCGVYASSVDPLTRNRWFGRGAGTDQALQALETVESGYAMGLFIRAMDVRTGKKVWDYPEPPGSSTGVLSTAGGLVFLGSRGGMVALDGNTGKPVWHIDLGQRSSAAPATYMVGGKQYIVLAETGVIVAYALVE
jgi:alcohol dehydrogenase (cytochrome c)